METRLFFILIMKLYFSIRYAYKIISLSRKENTIIHISEYALQRLCLIR